MDGDRVDAPAARHSDRSRNVEKGVAVSLITHSTVRTTTYREHPALAAQPTRSAIAQLRHKGRLAPVGVCQEQPR